MTPEPSESTSRWADPSETTPLLHGEENTSDDEVNRIDDFDDILELVGSKGLYQKTILYGCIVPLTFILAAVSYTNVFTMFVPDHFCKPREPVDMEHLDEWKRKYIPLVSNSSGREIYSSCAMYNYTADESNRNNTIPCQNGWIFDTKDFDRTIATENSWVCDRDFYSTTAFTANSVGFLIGNIIFGQLTDKYGRKPILFWSLALYITFAMISPFVTRFYQLFVAVNFLSAAGFPMVYSLPPLLMAELSASDYRAWTYTVNWVAWVLGTGFLPMVAYFARNWLIISLSLTTPGLLLFFLFPFIPESPRWLLTRGRIHEAELIVRGIAKGNGRSQVIEGVDLQSILQGLATVEQEDENKILGVWSLFGTKRIAMITCCIAISRSASAMISDQLTLNSLYLSGNQFSNFFIMAISQLPGTVLAGYLIERIGRRWLPVVGGIILAGMCLLAAVVSNNQQHIRTACSIVATFAVSILQYVQFVQTAELFPTPLRATGSALCTTVSSFASLLDASIVYTRKVFPGAPYLVMLLISLMGSVSSAFLPETLGRHLPETVEEACRFGAEDKFWSFRNKYSRIKPVSPRSEVPC